MDITLSIAHIQVSLISNHEHLSRSLHERYEAFSIGSPTTTDLRVSIELDNQFQPAQATSAAPLFSPATSQLLTPGCACTLDIAARAARLRVPAAYSIGDIDYCLRAIYALLAYRRGGVLFHGAGIVRNQRALLFFGHSGSGKTTVARLSPGDLVLNDDLVLLLPHNSGWMVYATPFSNSTQVGPAGPYHAPLAALLRLVQAKQVFLEAMSRGRAVAELLSCMPMLITDDGHSHQLLDIGQRLVCAVPIYRLHFLPDASFWQVVAPLLENEAL